MAFRDITPVAGRSRARPLALSTRPRVEAVPGHTPGSSIVKPASGSDQALFAGDLLHTPLQVTHPDHNSCFCQDPAQSRTTRRKLLGWAADTGALLPARLSGHRALEVQDTGNGFAIKSWAPFTRY